VNGEKSCELRALSCEQNTGGVQREKKMASIADCGMEGFRDLNTGTLSLESCAL